jgi:hypothetical protein
LMCLSLERRLRLDWVMIEALSSVVIVWLVGGTREFRAWAGESGLSIDTKT